MSTVQYAGSNHLRQRLVCSTLSNKTIRINDIRTNSSTKGLQAHEASLLRLMDKLTKGSEIQINQDGTSLLYKPGVILGGSDIVHECDLSRGIGYYLEVVLCLAPFAKKPVDITLRGITNHQSDVSVDTFRNCTLHIFKLFGFETDPTIQIVKRGAHPQGGGEIRFTCPIVKKLKPVQILDEGMVKRVRGIAYATRVAPAIANRMVEGSRAMLNNFIPDVWVYTDHYQGKTSGKSPGYALYLQAETDTDCRLSVEYVPVPQDPSSLNVPEDIGKHVAELLLEEIKKGGCIDSSNQYLVFLMMALSPEDVSKVRIGKLSEYAISYLRHIRDFFGVVFKITPEQETNTIVLSCKGSGYHNLSRRSN
ncbi:RNA 3'-terminal phosphate cyclase [Acrasis kona]|uniref:RNA 3'-terminal phosphate cyclase n=1 Tax=Acrasis kona TaxID=1008807 RepID=A0AAW2Z7V3_9EUKA